MEGRFSSRKLRPSIKAFTGKPDLLPFLDVFFLLLVFLTLSTPFVQVSGVEVRLPQVDAGRVRAGLERFIITIGNPDGKPRIYFNDKPLSVEALAEELSRVSRQTGMNMVIIRADAAVPHATVTEVMAIAARYGLSTFLATGRPERSGESSGGAFTRPGE